MRDNSISRALPRPRAAAVPPRRTCLDGRFGAFRGPRVAVWARSSNLLLRVGPSRASASPTHRPIPCAGASACRALPRAGASARRPIPRAGASACRAARRLLPRQPLSSQLLPHQPPRTRSVQKGQLLGRDWPSNCPSCTFFERSVPSRRPARHTPIRASPRGRARVRGPRPRGQQP